MHTDRQTYMVLGWAADYALRLTSIRVGMPDITLKPLVLMEEAQEGHHRHAIYGRPGTALISLLEYPFLILSNRLLKRLECPDDDSHGPLSKTLMPSYKFKTSVTPNSTHSTLGHRTRWMDAFEDYR